MTIFCYQCGRIEVEALPFCFPKLAEIITIVLEFGILVEPRI